MKKIFLIILIITLPLICFFQYKSYRRFHPPVDYVFEISDSIDVNYHNVPLVDEYFSKAIEVGYFAKYKWFNEGIDVRFPDAENLESVNASKYYNQLIARVNYLEKLLKNSLSLKNKGLSNEEIKLVESGSSIADLKWMKMKPQILNIAFGERSEYVWQVQKQLISKGYEHRLDGLFGLDTQNAIISFQNDNSLFPSGTITEGSFSSLFLK